MQRRKREIVYRFFVFSNTFFTHIRTRCAMVTALAVKTAEWWKTSNMQPSITKMCLQKVLKIVTR